LQGTEKKGKKGNEMKRRGGPSAIVVKGPHLLVFFSSTLCVAFKLQGFGHVWVQLPKELYMENK
jgi:hypothetical protein